MAEVKEIKQSVNELQITGTIGEINLQKETKEVELKRGDTTKKVTCDVISKKEFKNPSMTVKVERKDENGNVTNETLIDVEIVNYFNQNSKSLNDKNEVEDNRNFKALETVMNEYKSGTRVQITTKSGAIEENGYVGKDGQWSSRIRINGQYLTSNNVPEEDKADAKISGVIRSIRPEMKNDEETGRLFIDFYMFNFRGETYPVTLVVESDLAPDVEDIYSNGDSCQFDVELLTRRVGKVTTKKESAFGRRESKIVEGYNVTELSVFGGDPVFEEENDYYIDMETMKTAMKERDIMIEQRKKDKADKEKEKSSGSNRGLNRKGNTVTSTADSPF